ncbi:MAG TPA: AsmA family protein, partial [bacterium]
MSKKRIKKIIRILLGIGIVFMALIAITALVLSIIYPPSKLKRLAASEIESAINRKAEIEDVWLNPFKGFIITNITIYEPAHGDSASPIFFKADNVQLSYNLFSLLKKEVNIYKVQISQPVLNIFQDKDLRWNFDDLIAEDTLAVPPDTSTAEMSLPVSFKLKEFSFENFTANISMQMSDTTFIVKTGGVSFKIHDLYLKGDTFEELKNKTRADFKLFTDEETWEFTLKTDSPPEVATLTTTLKLALDIDINGLQKVDGTGTIALENVVLKLWNDQKAEPQELKFPIPEMASMSFALATDADQGVLILDHFSAFLAKENLFNIKGKITQLFDQPNINLEVTESDIDLRHIVTSVIAFLPDSLRQQFRDLALQGNASIKGTKISGNPLSEKLDDALSFLFVLSVEDFYNKYPDAGTDLENLNLHCRMSGIMNACGVPKTDIVANLSIDTLSVAIDTLNFSFSDWKLHLTSSLDADFFPESADIDFAIGDFLGVPLTFLLNFSAQDQLNKYELDGELSVKELPLRNIPEAMMEGALDFGVKLHSKSLDQINVDMDVITDIIEFSMEGEPEPYIFSPMDIHANALVATDTTFEKFDIKEITMQISDFASGLMHGNFLIGAEQKLTLVVDELKVDHEKVMAIVPAQLLVDLETLKITGHSNLTANLVVTIPETEDLIIHADGKIKVHAGVDYPDVYFKLDRINGEIEFDSDGETATVKLNAMLDSLTIEDVQDVPLRKMPITAFGHLPDFETFILDSAFMQIPELMTRAIISATIDSLSGNLVVNGKGRLLMDTDNQSISLMNDMIRLNGNMSLDVDMNYVGDIVAAIGNFNIEYLKVD